MQNNTQKAKSDRKEPETLAFGALVSRDRRFQSSKEFKDWNYHFYFKNLQNPDKFHAIYSDDFVDALEVVILLSREYVSSKSQKSGRKLTQIFLKNCSKN